MIKKGLLVVMGVLGIYTSLTGSLAAALVALFGNTNVLSAASDADADELLEILGLLAEIGLVNKNPGTYLPVNSPIGTPAGGGDSGDSGGEEGGDSGGDEPAEPSEPVVPPIDPIIP